ncbi:MAG: caspase family protein [Chloroflexales bacterium]
MQSLEHQRPSTIYALLVGINNYPAPIPPLRGCVPDIEHMCNFLQNRVVVNSTQPEIKVLLNAEATRQRVIDMFYSHLGQAHSGDVALFYFSGHGAQQISPPEFWPIEPDHLDETLVCYDSRVEGSWDLADKELSQLIAEVADRGAHVLVILDACHSGSGTRTSDSGIGVRRAPTDTRIRPLSTYYGLDVQMKAVATDSGFEESNWLSPRAGRHIVISACRSEEEAKEQIFDGQSRGVLSYYLLQSLQQTHTHITYRDLYKQLKAHVESRVSLQSPLIEATIGADLNLSFLGGAVTSGRPYFTVARKKQDAWVVDGGAVHGLQPGVADEHTMLALYPFDSEVPQLDSFTNALGVATVMRVGPGESTVVLALNDGQLPDPTTLFKAVVIALPLPPVVVTMQGDAQALELVRAALTDNDMGGPSLLVHEARTGEELGTPALQLTALDGAYRIRRSGDRYPLSFLTTGYTAQSAGIVVGRLEHIARWLNILALANPTSQLPQNAVELAVFLVNPVTGQDVGDPVDVAEVRLAYIPHDGVWVEPEIKIRLRNTTDRILHCCLLDLTEAFGVSADLLPGGSVRLAPQGAVGDEAWANDGRPIPLYIPNDLQHEGITALQDVLKLIVSTSEISGYWLAQSGLEATTRSFDIGNRALADDTLSRLMRRVFQRDLGQNPASAARRADWQCQELTLHVSFPPEAVPVPTDKAERADLGGGVWLAGHMGLRAHARIVSQSTANRSMGNLALPPVLRDHPELSTPFALMISRSGTPIRSVFELLFEADEGPSYALVTPEHPLVLQVETPLAEVEGVLALAFDGECYLPLGTYRRTATGGTELRLERLPHPTTEGQRSLGGAIKIFFQKLLCERVGLHHTYPRLAIPTITSEGTVSYDDDMEVLRACIAAAPRIRLYLHGIIGDTEGMARSAYAQREATHPADASPEDLVLTFDYESIHTEIETTARDLKRKLNDLGLGVGHGKHLAIVAHSMGGLVARWLIEKEGGNHLIQQLTMVGTPNGGSPWPTVQGWATTAIGIGVNFISAVGWPAKVLAWLVAAIEVVDKPLDQMEPGSMLLRGLAVSDPPGVPYAIVAGNTSIIERVREQTGANGVSVLSRLIDRLAPQHLLYDLTALAFFREPNDVAVSVRSITAVPEGFVRPEDVLEVPCDHMTYFTAVAGLRALMRALGR